MFDLKHYLPLIFSILGVVTLFVTFKLKLERDSKKSQKLYEGYFEREFTASFTRKKELDTNLLINVNFNDFPVVSDQDCKMIYDNLLSYSNKKMADLKGYSNLQLKETYGLSQFELLADYEKNYLSFMDILVKYGSILYEKDFVQEAQITLEEALKYHCDVSKCYFILSDIYLKSRDVKKLKVLSKTACSHMKDSYYFDKVMHKIESAEQAAH